MDDPRNAQMLDLVDQALKGNMAVVLVADVMPHKSLSDALTMTQWTPTAIWEYEKDPKVTFGRSSRPTRCSGSPTRPICSRPSRCISCRPASTC